MIGTDEKYLMLCNDVAVSSGSDLKFTVKSNTVIHNKNRVLL